MKYIFTCRFTTSSATSLEDESYRVNCELVFTAEGTFVKVSGMSFVNLLNPYGVKF